MWAAPKQIAVIHGPMRWPLFGVLSLDSSVQFLFSAFQFDSVSFFSFPFQTPSLFQSITPQ